MPDRVAGIRVLGEVLVELFREFRGLQGNAGVRVTVADHPGAAPGRNFEECLIDVAHLPVVRDHIHCLLLTDLPGIVFFRELVQPEGAGTAPHEQTRVYRIGRRVQYFFAGAVDDSDILRIFEQDFVSRFEGDDLFVFFGDRAYILIESHYLFHVSAGQDFRMRVAPLS